MPTVGVINPSVRGGRPEQLIRILPAGIGLEISRCDIASHTVAELEAAFGCFDRRVAEAAALAVDLIHPAGVSFLLLGPDGERDMIDRWQRRHAIPVFTNPMAQANALRALGARRVVSASYFATAINARFSDYLVRAGFDVLESAAFGGVPFDEVPGIERSSLRAFFGGLCERNPRAEALNLFGPGWQASFDLIGELEDAYGIPVIHHVAAQSWEIQKRLGLRHPVEGYGRLVRELP
jgi:maleate cis-trans isomerase